MLRTFVFQRSPCQSTARRGGNVRTVPRRPHGVLTSGLTSSNQSFTKRHQEVLQDSEWYGPEAPDHAVSPAAVAAAPATVANRSDVRLMSKFTLFLRTSKLDLSSIFCSDPLLSADSKVVCDLRAGHHGELLAEYLTSGSLRVGEELPHWFVNGNIPGAIKCWMTTRVAAAAVSDARAAAALASRQRQGVEEQQRQKEAEATAALAASVAGQGPLGAVARVLVDALLAAMPVWKAGAAQEMAGWEAAAAATAEDVALLHCFGAIVYAVRLDVTEFLQQLCGADPFAWAVAQVNQGTISEPEPWLLERYFMSRHVVGEPLPLWFTTWGVRNEIRQWLQGHKAMALVKRLLEARGFVDETGSTAAGPGSSTIDSAPSPSDDSSSLAEALSLLEAAAASILASAVPASNSNGSAVHCQRGVQLSHIADANGQSYAADLVARRDDRSGAAMVAVTVQLPASAGGASTAVTDAVRQAKERLEWLAFLLSEENKRTVGPASPCAAGVVKVLLLMAEEGARVEPPQLAASVQQYLVLSGVRCVSAAKLA